MSLKTKTLIEESKEMQKSSKSMDNLHRIEYTFLR